MHSPASEPSTPQIFVIEDNPADVRMVREGIDATDIEVAVTVINGGRQAAERLSAIKADRQEKHPKLILLDLNLPGRSGFELLELIREETAFPDVPVVIVSSSENREDINRVYEQSANAYVMKPTDPDDYIRMINATVDFWIGTATVSTND